MSIADLILIISTTVTGIVTIINSIANGWGRKSVDSKLNDASSKLDAIHESSNGNLVVLNGKLETVTRENERLKAELMRLNLLAAPSTVPVGKV